MFSILRRLILGKPIPTRHQQHHRLSKFLALPVFASDALSSTAYATEEILLAFALVGAGSLAWGWSLPITAAIVGLLAIVVVSYRLTIHAYPQGGGSYVVTRENLGVYPGLVAASSLLIDYVLTVAVSIAAGVSAIISAAPGLAEQRIELCLAAIVLVALLNMRGLKESGALFAIPTYAFVVSLALMIGTGLYRVLMARFGGPPIVPVHGDFPHSAGNLSNTALFFLALRAFAGGCSAMTGTEAVADGVQAFRPPESRNASTTLVYMAIMLGGLFFGISYLAGVYHAIPGTGGHGGEETVLSQIASGIFGRTAFYYVIQIATATILVLAANTAYQDFPRLSSILARDRFAPRQLMNIGDRLVFTNGILLLSGLAALLIVGFRGDTHALIPLYAVGVFLSFTLSQFSMGLRQRKLRQQGWQYLSLVSFFGSIVTMIVAVVIASMKFAAGPKVHLGPLAFPTGAYIVLLLIVVMVYVLKSINNHYLTLGKQLRVTGVVDTQPVRSTAIVLTAGFHRGVLQALEYAQTLSHDCRALYVETDPVDTPIIKQRWEEAGLPMPLVIIESPYRTVVDPVLNYIEEAKKERRDHVVTVVLPEFVSAKWWHGILHNQSGLLLKIALMFRRDVRDVVVTNVRYYLEE